MYNKFVLILIMGCYQSADRKGGQKSLEEQQLYENPLGDIRAKQGAEKVESFLDLNPPPPEQYNSKSFVESSYPKEQFYASESTSNTGVTTNASPMRGGVTSSFVDNPRPSVGRRSRKQRIEDSVRRSNHLN